MKKVVLKGNELKLISSKSIVADLISMELASRKRTRNVISLSRIKDLIVKKNVFNYDDHAFTQYWKDLESLNLGKRKGNSFVFHCDPIAVGTVCTNGIDAEAKVFGLKKRLNINSKLINQRFFKLNIEIPIEYIKSRLSI